jgi:hypothetical protein
MIQMIPKVIARVSQSTSRNIGATLVGTAGTPGLAPLSEAVDAETPLAAPAGGLVAAGCEPDFPFLGSFEFDLSMFKLIWQNWSRHDASFPGKISIING